MKEITQEQIRGNLQKFSNLTRDYFYVDLGVNSYEEMRNQLRAINHTINDYTWELTWNLSVEIPENNTKKIYGIN